MMTSQKEQEGTLPGQLAREKALSSEEFSLFRTLIFQESGLFLTEAKKEFLEYRLVRRMKETGASSPYWYYRYLLDNRVSEMPRLLELLTINETSFFRIRPQFDLLRDVVLPGIVAEKKQSRTPALSVWSAGCSTGEEPYSIAMEVTEFLGPVNDWRVKIYASDLNMQVLAQASRGRYPSARVTESVPPHLVQRYFIRQGDEFLVTERIRKLVVFDFHNLMHDNGLTDLDVIFCRNVMIYFDGEDQRKLIDRFHRSLKPGGYFFLGASETLQGVDDRFRFIFHRKGAAYRKAGGHGS
jgi:chemotaxis protein methyltransferase CheR